MTIRVNGEDITDESIRYELARLVKFYSEHMSEAEVHRQMDLLRGKARDQAIGARLLIEETRRLDIRLPAGDVEARLDQLVENAGGEEVFAGLLARQGLTREQLRGSIEQGRRVDLLVEKITEGASEPTEKEMKQHYETHREEYRVPEQAQVQHILIKPATSSDHDRNLARSKLRGIRRKIEDGAEFADMASAFSECPSGRRSGGSLGWIARGTLVKEFDDAVFPLSLNALSEIVETPLGFHLVRKTGQRESRPADYDDVREKVRDFLRHAARGAALSAYVEELRAKAVIEED